MTELSNDELKRLVEKFRRACIDRAEDGDALSFMEMDKAERALTSKLEQLQAENAELKEKLAASEKDAARLDSGRILLVEPDESGKDVEVIYCLADLRAAIDAAIQPKDQSWHQNKHCEKRWKTFAIPS